MAYKSEDGSKRRVELRNHFLKTKELFSRFSRQAVPHGLLSPPVMLSGKVQRRQKLGADSPSPSVWCDAYY